MFVGCGGIRAGVQVSKREFHTHIHLDYVRVKFLYCIIKKKVIVGERGFKAVNKVDKDIFEEASQGILREDLFN